jgi:hypothetical protein
MDLDEALDIRSGGMPRGAAVLVTDEVDASGGWLISHLLRRALVSAAAGSDDADASRRAQAGSASASRPPGRVCLIAAEQPASHYTRTLAKLGRDARADLASGRLVVVDLLSPSPFDAIAAADAGEDEEEPGFQNSEIDRDLAPARALFQTIARALDALPPKLGSAFGNAETETETETEDGDDARFVAVFDDVHAALESVRVPARSMSAAVDGLCRSLLSLKETAVVVGAHLDAAGVSASAPGGWLFALDAVADARLDVAALKTGAARDVHGRVRVTHRTGRFVRVRSSENGSSAAFGRGEKDTTIRKRASAKFGLAETGARATRES